MPKGQWLSEDVRAQIGRSDEPNHALALRYGVSPHTVSRIKSLVRNGGKSVAGTGNGQAGKKRGPYKKKKKVVKVAKVAKHANGHAHTNGNGLAAIEPSTMMTTGLLGVVRLVVREELQAVFQRNEEAWRQSKQK